MSAPLVMLAALVLQPVNQTEASPASTPAPAVREAGRAVREACAADTKALCGDVQPGGGRIMQCFRQKHRELTPLCRGALADLRRARKAG